MTTTESVLLGPAVAAAALTAAATFVANAIRAVYSERKRRRGLVTALRAEIGERQRAQKGFLDGTDFESVKDAIEANPDYVPFTTSDPDFSCALYDELRKDVSVLDGQTLEAVVRFYVEDNLTQAMVVDLRTDLFRSLAPDRKKRYMDLLKAQARETVQAGDKALAALLGRFPQSDDGRGVEQHS